MAEPLRILQIVGILNCGGAESMIMNLYRNIDRERVQFDFIVHTNEEGMYDKEVYELGGKIYHCPKFSGKNIVSYRHWWINFFREHPEYKVLHSHIRSCASVYFSIASKFGVKTIIHSHSTSNGEGFSSVVKKVLQFPLRYQADYLMACSKKAGIWLYGNRACNSEKYFFLPNAVDLEKYHINEQIRQEYRQLFGLGENLVFGHVGRFHESKNHPFLLETFAKIHRENENTILLLIGDGELRGMIEETVKRYGLEKAIVLLGLRRDVDNLLQAMDVLLFPSVWEGLPVTVIEAQAAGVPCIISDNITTDVDVTELVYRLPINDTIKWKDLALSGLQRKDVSDKVKESGFDVKESARMLASFYEKIVQEI